MAIGSDLLKSLAVGLPALIVGFASVGVTWAKDLGRSARRLRILDESQKRIAFWDAWLKTTSSYGMEITDEIEDVRADIALSAARVLASSDYSQRQIQRTVRQSGIGWQFVYWLTRKGLSRITGALVSLYGLYLAYLPLRFIYVSHHPSRYAAPSVLRYATAWGFAFLCGAFTLYVGFFRRMSADDRLLRDFSRGRPPRTEKASHWS